ncbi:hypothetical protein TWF506_010521 [Arthrobotrys conoides]|uniref:Uncharacterized protein n=1 Tax=Arthrobotrys conoides TaxID=74498 RepID=A0AAN8NF36_9PEZI
MPGSSRLLVVAVSSLLMSSALAGVIYPGDLQTVENGVLVPRHQGSASNSPNPLSESPRFPRYKRQEVAIDEGSVVAAAEPAPTELEETTEDVVESTETKTVTEDTHSDSPGSTGDTGPSGGSASPVDDSQTAMGEGGPPDGRSQPLPPPPPGISSEEFGVDAPPLTVDETGDPKEGVAATQQLIAESRKELENDSPEMSQKELDDMATAVELISADLSKREDPATVDIEDQVTSELSEWESLTDAEKKEKHERALYERANQDAQLTAVVSNLLGIAKEIVNGDVKTNATEGLEGIPSEDVPANSTDVSSPVETGEASARLRKRSLNKRFVVPGILGLLGVRVNAGVNFGITTPLSSFALALTTGIGKATNAEPPKPQEKIVFVERQQPQPTLEQPQQSFQQQSFRQESFRQSQQPTANQFESVKPTIMEYQSQQPKSTVPGWDPIYQQNQGFGQNYGGFTQTLPSWRKSRRRLR